MATYTKQKLSGSTNGKQISISETASPGGTVHTSVSGTSDYDEIWLWAANSSAAEVKLTIEWGGTANPDDLINVFIASEMGYALIVPGLLLQNELVVRAFAATGDVINISGFVNRITA